MGKKEKKHNKPLNHFVEKLKARGVKNIRVDQDGTVFATVPLDQTRVDPPDPKIIEEGGLQSFVKFIHKCLALKGFGTPDENHYEWTANSQMAWFDPQNPRKFPDFVPGPGKIEEPVYVFKVTKLRGKTFQWLVAAEVDDILAGSHVKHEEYWVPEYLNYIQTGILDRLDHPDEPWIGGMGVVRVV